MQASASRGLDSPCEAAGGRVSGSRVGDRLPVRPDSRGRILKLLHVVDESPARCSPSSVADESTPTPPSLFSIGSLLCGVARHRSSAVTAARSSPPTRYGTGAASPARAAPTSSTDHTQPSACRRPRGSPIHRNVTGWLSPYGRPTRVCVIIDRRRTPSHVSALADHIRNTPRRAHKRWLPYACYLETSSPGFATSRD